MSWFDSLFSSGGNTQPTAKPAPMLPASTQAATAGFPDQATWLANYIKAQGDLARTRPTSFYNWISGNQGNAAREMAAVTGPSEYFKQLEAQPDFTAKNTAAQSGQLGLIQRLAQTGLVSGQDIDPNNIPAALPAYLKAMRAQFPDMAPGGVPGAPGAPDAAAPAAPTMPNAPAPPQATSAPLPPPMGANASPLNPTQPPAQPPQMAAPNAAPAGFPLTAPPAAPAAVDPQLVRQRAMLERWGQFSNLFGDPAVALKFYEEANRGMPGGSRVLGGRAVEGVTGNPINMTGQDFTAQGDFKTALAKEIPHVAGQQTIDNNQTANQRGTDQRRIALDEAARIAETNNEKSQTPITGYSTETGQPMVAPASALKNGLPGFSPGVNPYIEKHAKEQEAASKDAQDAATGIIQAQQLVEAAQNIVTGAWGDDIQDIRRGLSTLGVASPKLMTAAKKGDVVNELGTELAALRARAATGGRVPMSTFQIFRSVKPGLLSTDPAAVAAPIIASFQRQLDFAEFQNKYYGDQKNWNKLDAVDAFRAANPDQKYVEAARVPEPTNGAPTQIKSDADHAKLPKGASYIDPNGNIRTKR